MARELARLTGLLLLVLGLGAAAQTPDQLRVPQTPWSRLSPDDQRILAPVAPEWERMPGYQQQRLMSSARRYPSLQPIQKERFQQRIREWAAMTPEQRRQAREAYRGMRQLPPDAFLDKDFRSWLDSSRG